MSGMVDTCTSEQISVLTKVRNLEERWKQLAHMVENGKITPDQYLDFEIPFLKSTLRTVTSLSEVAEARKPHARASFFLRRAGLPTLMLSIDDSGIFQVEPADESRITRPMPGIEFADTSLYIEGILGLSSRQSYMTAYVSGGIRIHELHRFRKWAPYILAKLFKIDPSVYHAIVCDSGELRGTD